MESAPISDFPTTVQLDIQTGVFEPCLDLSQRRLNDLAMMFYDQQAVQAQLKDNPLIYEIRYYPFVTSNSDMALGVTSILPGVVGDEYYMTKGHFHTRPDQPEIYYCVKGHGYLLMESWEGDFRTAAWEPGVITHIPPQYAHRVVNTGDELLVFVASFHLSAGHNYEPVIQHGFAQLVVERDGQPVFRPNPHRER
jgi:glucose-6-phosphate isomerase